MSDQPNNTAATMDDLYAHLGRALIQISNLNSQIEALQTEIQERQDWLSVLKSRLMYPQDMRFEDILDDLSTESVKDEVRGLRKAAQIALAQIKEPALPDNPAYVNFEPARVMARQIAGMICTEADRIEEKS